MKLLFVHNRYGKRSGEEIMLDRIVELLRARGHDVDTWFADSADIEGVSGKLGAAASGICSPSSRRAIASRIAQDRPDIVQVQNLYPLISPAVLPVIAEAGVPIVMRLSNYRLVCPNGLFLSHGQVCEACSGGKEWNCVAKNCENDLFKSAAYAARNAFARRQGYYRDNVTRYYAQTEFQRSILVRDGYPADRIDVIPNMIDVPEDAPEWTPGSYVGFVGRLSHEKGIDTLLAAARRTPDVRYKLAGSLGAYEGRSDIPGNVELLGNLEPDELARFYREAALIAVPSIWYEGFPGVMIEAMRNARPLVVSDIGGLPEIVGGGRAGVLVPPHDDLALSQAIATLLADVEKRRELGEAGFARVKREYTRDLYYQRLMATYERALSGKQQGAPR
ncbi:glycosyltransferase family 4 protein [Aurantiacibacter poecillastricola]|uniref:glycosyltransferase family 4 protein n=1 Tax=Aurantiacibacter poecillastricola TaxID=3064385 RepID=UPI00273D2BF6|nr:glycosyltransferase family 4 protein [Aurantiacibacter sp. 219JJ12-13]MDP5260020.1 glycosyltransferase family 4 protein [Aurantiacibacter sp. 219JJ12-13]